MVKLEEGSDMAGSDARHAEAEQNGKLRDLGVNRDTEGGSIAPSNLVGQIGAHAGFCDAATVRMNAIGPARVLFCATALVKGMKRRSAG